MRDMIAELDYEEWLVQNSSSRQAAEKRMSNIWFLLDSLLRNLPDDERKENDALLADALAKLALQDMMERQQQEDDANQVQLMTLHASKGLEFPHVFIMGLEENLLPHRNSIEAETIEEERRLFYVGITRAQKSLTLTLATERKQYGETHNTDASRFLQELPEEDLAWEGGMNICPEAKRKRGKSAIAGLRDLMGSV